MRTTFLRGIKPTEKKVNGKRTNYIKGKTTMSIAFSWTWNPKLNTMKLVNAK